MGVHAQPLSYADAIDLLPQRLSNGSVDPESSAGRMVELQEIIEKNASDLGLAKSKITELSQSCLELEESLSSTQKDLIKSQEQTVKLQAQLREVRGRGRVLAGGSMGVWRGVAMDSLKFHLGLPCLTFLRPAGRPALKRPYGHFWGSP
jgi:hypothetical protein